MARKRKIAPANEFTIRCDRIFRWLVEHAGADSNGDRFAESVKIHALEAPGGLITTKAGGAAGAFSILHVVTVERPLSVYYREVVLACDEEAAEVDRLLQRLTKRMAEFDRRARADRDEQIEKFGDVYAQSGGMVVHWPSKIAEKMRRLIPAVGVARLAAGAVREVVGEIPTHLMDADLSDCKLSIAEDAALKLADGGFTSAEIAALMDIDEKKGDPPELKVDRWRKTVERARTKVTPLPDKPAGTSASVDSPTDGAARSSRAARHAAPRSVPAPRRRARRTRR